MQLGTALALKVLIFIGIPFIVFFVFIAKVYPKISDRRQFKDFFGFSYNCFSVKGLVREKILLFEEEVRTLIANTIEIFKPSNTVDIFSVDINFLLDIWEGNIKMIEQKVKELEEASLLAEKFGIKKEAFLLSKSLD